ncbi:MAG: hypothetical protein M1824_000017 [Vezdaea acicularis]|nr:MAG: hypothetical protein M1824_000017 [Vezdaea acicularis]
MRLFLVPVSKHRTLIYCQRLKVSSAERESYANRISAKAAQTWLQWEKSETGWKKKVTNYGNKALQRIAFEEWGLKSIPPLTAKRKEEYSTGKRTEVLFPTSRIQAALRGSEHVEFLVSKNLLDPTPSASLDVVYPKDQKTQGGKTLPGSVQADKTPTRDVLLLDPQSGKKIAEALQVPELAVEIERAVHQVEASIKAEIELNDEKQSIARATNSAAEPVDKGSK